VTVCVFRILMFPFRDEGAAVAGIHTKPVKVSQVPGEAQFPVAADL
jgi:hypothetical protein